MIPPWILPLFAGMTAAVDSAFATRTEQIPASMVMTTDGDSTYTLNPFIWTDLTMLSSTTIISTAITQSIQILPALDPCQTDPSDPTDNPAAASEPSSPLSS